MQSLMEHVTLVAGMDTKQVTLGAMSVRIGTLKAKALTRKAQTRTRKVRRSKLDPWMTLDRSKKQRQRQDHLSEERLIHRNVSCAVMCKEVEMFVLVNCRNV